MLMASLRRILNYIFECSLQQHWRIYKENGDSGNLTAFEKADCQWEQIIIAA